MMSVRTGALLRCLLRRYGGARAGSGRFIVSGVNKNNKSST